VSSTRTTASLALALALGPVPALAQVEFGPHDVRTVFFIAKSQNRNRVDYALSLDAECRPKGAAPVRPYWRLFEEGGRLEPLARHERRAYGIASQRVRATRGGYVVELRLRALPERPIEVHAVKDSSGRCRAGAITPIRGQRAELHSIFVQLASGLIPRVDSVLVEGRAVTDHRYLRERLTPA